MSDSRVVQRINEVAIELIKGVPSGPSDRDVIRGDTGDVARTMAILNTAIFDAVNGIHQKYDQIMIEDEPPPTTSAKVAAATAGRIILKGLFSDSIRRKFIEQAYSDLLSDISTTASRERNGIVWGKAVAAEVLAERLYDVPVPGEQAPTRPGGFNLPWRAQYAGMRPFVMGRQDRFLPDPPPPSSSNRYAAALKEVQKIGARVTSDRSADETAAARAWNGGGGTSRPTGAWFEAAIFLADSEGLTTRRAARLFSLLGLTICDCMISSWHAKATYDYWRPQDAIRMAHLDGNSKTEPDLSWLQLSGSIGGSPEFTSGTATFAGGASQVLRTFFETDSATFEMNLQGTQGTTRTYNTFTEAAIEAGMSRIWNGIHYQFSNEAGMDAGKKIADLVLATYPLK